MKALVLVALLAAPCVAQTDIQFSPSSLFVQSSPGVPYEIGIDTTMVVPPGFSFDGFQNALLMPNPTQTSFVGYGLGAAAAALNGGAGPDYVQADTIDFGGLTDNLMTFGLIADLAGAGSLPLTGSYELVRFEFVSASVGNSFFVMSALFATNPPAGNFAVYRDLPQGPASTIPTVPFDILIFQEISIVEFIRGDANQDRATNISDPVFMLNSLFGPTFPVPACLDAADANDDGTFNLADPITVLFFLFSGGPPPPPPFPACDIDPTGDTIDCISVPPLYC